MLETLDSNPTDFGESRIILRPEDALGDAKATFGTSKRSRGQGYFSVSNLGPTGRWRDHYCDLANLEVITKGLQNRPDTYISQASFLVPSRKTVNMAQINSVFVDVDCYTLGLPNDDTTVKNILARAAIFGVPEPTFVMSSGRGLYLKWMLDTPLSSTMLPVWKKVAGLLNFMFASFGSDAKVKDASRVLRPVGSINTKVTGPDASVRVVHGNGRVHNFDALTQILAKVDLPSLFKLDPKLSERLKQSTSKLKANTEAQVEIGASIGDLGALVEYEQTRLPIMLTRGTLMHVNWCRFLDLRDIAFIRGGIPEGMRDNFMFWMASSLALSKVITPENFWGEMGELLRAVGGNFDPKADGSMSTLIAKIKDSAGNKKISYDGSRYDPIYTASNDYLINSFGITSDEMVNLRTIISYDEKLRRADAKVPGRAERRVARNESQAKAIEMRTQGMRVHDIANTLKVHKSTVSRWLSPVVPVEQPTAERKGSSKSLRVVLQKMAAQKEKEKAAADKLTKRNKLMVNPLNAADLEQVQSPAAQSAPATAATKQNVTPKPIPKRSKSRFEQSRQAATSVQPAADSVFGSTFTPPQLLPQQGISASDLPEEAQGINLFVPPVAPDIPSMKEAALTIMSAKGVKISPELRAALTSDEPVDASIIPEEILRQAQIELTLATDLRATLIRETQAWQHELKASLVTEKMRLKLIKEGRMTGEAQLRSSIADLISGKPFQEKMSVNMDQLRRKRAILETDTSISTNRPATFGQTPGQILSRHLDALRSRKLNSASQNEGAPQKATAEPAEPMVDGDEAPSETPKL